jgi:hypothetical protein
MLLEFIRIHRIYWIHRIEPNIDFLVNGLEWVNYLRIQLNFRRIELNSPNFTEAIPLTSSPPCNIGTWLVPTKLKECNFTLQTVCPLPITVVYLSNCAAPGGLTSADSGSASTCYLVQWQSGRLNWIWDGNWLLLRFVWARPVSQRAILISLQWSRQL